jgi:AcrR family transcriptional regulator
MGATHEHLVDAAETCIVRDGLAGLTMSRVALRARVSKATVYNHFRTRDDLLSDVLDRRLDGLCLLALRVSAEQGAAAAVAAAADVIAENPVLRALAAREPQSLVVLAVPGSGERWDRVRAVTASVRGGQVDDVSVDLTLRWLASSILVPTAPEVRGETARSLTCRPAATVDARGAGSEGSGSASSGR